MEGNTAGRIDGALLSLGGLGDLKDKPSNLSDCKLDGINAHGYENTDEGGPEADGGFDGTVYVHDIKTAIDRSTFEEQHC